MSPQLAIVIINYNTPELVAGAVTSILETRELLPLEIVVVDNASTQGSLKESLSPIESRLSESSEGEQVKLRVIYSPTNLGFTGGNNRGIRETSAPLILMLNSDTLVRPGCLNRCREYMKENPEVGILGPKLLDPGGSRQLSCRRFPSFRTALFNRYSLFTRWFPNNPWSRAYLMMEPSGIDPSEAEEHRAVDWVSGAAMFLTRKLYGAIGPLDESFFMYAEDVDYCLRAHEAGFEVHFFPEAEIEHLIGSSSQQLPFRTIWWRHQSMWTFYYKHYSRRIAFFDLMTLVGILLRSLIMIGEQSIQRGVRRSTRSESTRNEGRS